MVLTWHVQTWPKHYKLMNQQCIQKTVTVQFAFYIGPTMFVCPSLVWLVNSALFLGVVDQSFPGVFHKAALTRDLRTDSLILAEISFLLVFGQIMHFIFNRTFYMFFFLKILSFDTPEKRYEKRIIVILVLSFQFLCQTRFLFLLMGKIFRIWLQKCSKH